VLYASATSDPGAGGVIVSLMLAVLAAALVRSVVRPRKPRAKSVEH
jgi:hypothetical protein